MIDRQAASIASDLHDDLGDWIRRRLTKGVERQGQRAQTTLRECGIPLEVLREQWQLQTASQLSIRARKYPDSPLMLYLDASNQMLLLSSNTTLILS